MYKNSLYEKRSISDRVKELSILAIFTILIALVSLLVMDAIIYPLSYFAITRTDIFNFIIKDLSVFLMVIIMAWLFIRKIRSLHKDGLTRRDIVLYLLKRPVYYFSIAFTVLFLTAVIVLFLFIFLSTNNNLLMRLSNN